jgi:hypothetical protein
MTASFFLGEDNGQTRFEVEFYIDESSRVIQSAELKSYHDQWSVFRGDLQYWIWTFGGKEKVLEQALRQMPGKDPCTQAKEEKEAKLLEGA